MSGGIPAAANPRAAALLPYCDSTWACTFFLIVIFVLLIREW